MNKKRKSRKIKTYACDFETSTHVWNEKKAWVWAWGQMEIDGVFDKFEYGRSIDTFMEWLLKESKNVFFHNLKFDGSFIVSWLLNNGYEFIIEGNPAPYQFTGLIDGKKSWFNIRICVTGVRGGKHYITISDSLKKVPFALKKAAMAFNLPIMKGEIDYNEIREMYTPLTYNDYAYLRNDVEITARIMHFQVNESGLTKTTIGSDALHDFKEGLAEDKKERKRLWDIYYPVLNKKTDDFIRSSYFGGITQVKPDREGEIIGNGIVLDINSMYPFIQYTKLLPYGEPIPYKGKYKYDEDYPLYIQAVEFSFELKEDYLPVIQIKDSIYFNGREFLKSSDGKVVKMFVTSVQWEMIKEHYHLFDVNFNCNDGEPDGYKFRGKVGIFKNHIDKWMKVKSTSKGAKRELSKLMLNSPYGKFGTNPEKVNVMPYLDEEDGRLRFEEGQRITGDPIYTAYASFVTAYGRQILTSTIMKVYDRFVYCDTDSIHLEGLDVPKELDGMIDPNELGKWDKEGTFEKAKFIRAKTYCEMLHAKEVDSKDYWGEPIKKLEPCEKHEHTHLIQNLKCAGMPANVKKLVSFDDFKIGLEIIPSEENNWTGKLSPKQVEGGVLLVPRKFSLR